MLRSSDRRFPAIGRNRTSATRPSWPWRYFLMFRGPLLVALVLAGPVSAAPPVVVLANGTIHDGSGAPGKRGHLVLQGERILAIGDVPIPQGARVIDVEGMIVAPGFIDLHTHSDYPLQESGTRGNLN